MLTWDCEITTREKRTANALTICFALSIEWQKSVEHQIYLLFLKRPISEMRTMYVCNMFTRICCCDRGFSNFQNNGQRCSHAVDYAVSAPMNKRKQQKLYDVVINFIITIIGVAHRAFIPKYMPANWIWWKEASCYTFLFLRNRLLTMMKKILFCGKNGIHVACDKHFIEMMKLDCYNFVFLHKRKVQPLQMKLKSIL